MLKEIEQRIRLRQKELDRKTAENNLLERQAQDCDAKILEATDKVRIVGESLAFLEGVANSRRGDMKGKIENILTDALQLVYGASRKVEMVYAVKNNRSHLSFEIVKQTDDGEVRRVIDGTGSGLSVSDTVSVPLRVLVLLGSKSSKVCILDECFKHMNNERVPLVTKFIKVLTEKLGIQVILLSHHDSVREEADAVYEVRDLGNHSVIEKVV